MLGLLRLVATTKFEIEYNLYQIKYSFRKY